MYHLPDFSRARSSLHHATGAPPRFANFHQAGTALHRLVSEGQHRHTKQLQLHDENPETFAPLDLAIPPPARWSGETGSGSIVERHVDTIRRHNFFQARKFPAKSHYLGEVLAECRNVAMFAAVRHVFILWESL